jgi:hypothetical protein
MIRLLTGFLAFASLLHGQSISLVFSDGEEVADGFLDTSGRASEGMPWGILVDTEGAGFEEIITSGTMRVLDPDERDHREGGLKYLYGNTPAAPVTRTTPWGDKGAITTLTSVSYQGLAEGDPFALIWFAEPSGPDSAYGILQSPEFSIGGPGTTLSYSNASLFDGPGRFSADYRFAPIPEPAQAGLVAGLAILGLMVWRRVCAPRSNEDVQAGGLRMATPPEKSEGKRTRSSSGPTERAPSNRLSSRTQLESGRGMVVSGGNSLENAWKTARICLRSAPTVSRRTHCQPSG